MTSVVDTIADRAFAVAASRGVQVRLKTNVSPEVVLYDAAETSPTLLEALGFRASLRLVDRDGKTLTTIGEPVSFNPVLAVAYGAAIFFAVTLIGATLARLTR